MSVPLDRTALVLLASGLSRRFGWRDKLMQPLGGKPLVEHAASAVAALSPLARIAVCPSPRSPVAERLADRFVIAVNRRQSRGLGHSIAVGVQVAMQFKPDAVVICMGDMPFVEPHMLRDLAERLGGERRINIAHSGSPDVGARPPAAFDARCFQALQQLDDDDGAKRLMRDPALGVEGMQAPAPLLADVDTFRDLEFARMQLAIKARYRGSPY